MRLIDADSLLFELANESFPQSVPYGQGRNSVIESIKNAPAIDAVPVVRCKDCIFAEQNVTISHSDSGDYTVTLCLADTIPKIVDNYYFCAGGESKRKRKYNEID